MICSLLSREYLYGQDIDLQYVNPGHGLSQGVAQCLLQDSKGFLWIGTRAGLNRFDGYTFRVFRYDPQDTLSLIDNRVQCLMEDENGRLWIGTDGGLTLFDPAYESFHPIPLRDITDAMPQHNKIEAFTLDGHGDLWFIVGRKSLYRIRVGPDISLSDQLRTQPETIRSPSPGAPRDTLYGIINMSPGKLLLSASDGFDMISIDSVTGNFTFEDDPATFFSGDLRQLMQQKDPRDIDLIRQSDALAWIVYHDLVLRIDARTGMISRVTYPEDAAARTSPVIPGAVAIFESSDTKIWSGSVNGFQVYDSNIGVATRYWASQMIGAGVISMTEDRSGGMWMGSLGYGLHKFDTKTKRFSSIFSGDDSNICLTGMSLRSILLTSDQHLLLGAITKIQPNTLDQPGENLFPVVPIAGARSLLEDHAGRIWAGGSAGLYRLEEWEGKESVQLAQLEPEVTQLMVTDIIDSRHSGIWYATPLQLCHYDPDNKTQECYDIQTKSVSSTYGFDITVLHEDRDGRLWLGTSGGLLTFDIETKQFRLFRHTAGDPQSLSHDIVLSIEEDPFEPERFLWLGTAGGGLNRFDLRSGSCTWYSEQDGLQNPVVYGILSDNLGNLWLSTNQGLSVFDIRNTHFRYFDKQDGLQDNEFNALASYRTPEGYLFFGGINGLNGFMPERVLVVNHNLPQIALTDLRIANKSVMFRQAGSITERAIGYTNEIRIPPSASTFSFEFAALDFTAPDKNQYAYRLEGFDDTWQYIGGQHTATFTNMAPGHYTFRVKASNNDEIWNEEGISVKLIVEPPWYRTWWAFLLYLVTIVGLLLFFRKKEHQERELKHRLEMEQLKAEQLNEVNQMKSRFFANISHEIRTPLTLMMGQLESISVHIADDFIRKKADMAVRSGQDLMMLVTEMLELSRLEAGRMDLHLGRQDIIAFVKDLVAQFSVLARERRLSLDMETRVPTLFFAFDAEKLSKVVGNLLSNAMKFTPPGGSVRVIMEKSEGHTEVQPECVIITVADTGIGIPEDKLQHVFERFYQIELPGSMSGGGIGIGLAIVHELVLLHGGQVTVSSAIGKGTSFRVELPITDDQDISALPEPLRDDAIQQHLRSTRLLAEEGQPVYIRQSGNEDQHIHGFPDAPMVLVVEDNAALRNMVMAQLEEAGYRTIEASNGEDGLAMATEMTPELIITDIMMPQMDGLEFSRRIRSDIHISHIPVIILTARSGEEEKIEGLLTGVDDYLTKPFSSRELLVRVANLIRIRRMLREQLSTATIIRPSEVSVVPADRVFLDTIISDIEKNISEDNYGVEALSGAVFMSPTHLHRKLTALIGQSPGHLIRSIRLQRAAELLAARSGNINEIAYQVGFTSPETFAKSFKKQFGLTPTEYIQSKTQA